MFNTLKAANAIGIHNQISSYLFPDHPFTLGEKERYLFRGADVCLKRVGNRYGVPASSLTYSYTIVGDGFRVVVRAVWSDGGDAKVQILRGGTDDSDADLALNQWLRVSNALEDAA